jgi:hypothetical protein
MFLKSGEGERESEKECSERGEVKWPVLGGRGGKRCYILPHTHENAVDLHSLGRVP